MLREHFIGCEGVGRTEIRSFFLLEEEVIRPQNCICQYNIIIKSGLTVFIMSLSLKLSNTAHVIQTTFLIIKQTMKKIIHYIIGTDALAMRWSSFCGLCEGPVEAAPVNDRLTCQQTRLWHCQSPPPSVCLIQRVCTQMTRCSLAAQGSAVWSANPA